MPKLLQINLNRSRVAHDLADVQALDGGCDFMVASAPNRGATERRANHYANRAKCTSIVRTNRAVRVRAVNIGECFVSVKTDK